jgi:hemolysin activation/secretion protein
MKSLAVLGLSTAALLTSASFLSPARAQAPTREEIQRVPVAPVAPPPSRLKVEGGVERAPCPLADPRFADVTVTLSDVAFNNLRVVDPATLRPAFEAYLGKTVPIAVVCDIRDAAATILRRQGYLAAVQVPAQRIDNGIVQFDVLMARLVSVQVRGDAGRSERTIAAYLGKLAGEEVFNEKQAERYLLLARDLPGFDVRLTLRPTGQTPGEVIGEVTVVKVPFTIDANVQNYGSRDVGRFGGLIRGEYYDVLGFGDRLTAGLFSTAQTAEQNVVQLGYDMRIGAEGLTLGGRFTHAWTSPDLGANPGNNAIRSKTMLASLETTYPFLRTQATNVRGAFGLDLINQDVRLEGPTSATLFHLSRDRLRVLYGRIDFEAIDRDSITSTQGYSVSEPRWRVAGSYEVRKGLDILDATDACAIAACPLPNLSRPEGRPTAALVRFAGTAEFRPIPKVTLAISPRAQYTRSALASYEEMSGGNYTVGRGYDPGTIIGDKGVGFQAEFRVGSLSPKSQDDLAFQPYAFLDQAWVWNNDRLNNLGRQDLTSAGGGIRAAYGSHARLDVTVATPLQRAGLLAVRGDTRLLVSLTTKLIPW